MQAGRPRAGARRHRRHRLDGRAAGQVRVRRGRVVVAGRDTDPAGLAAHGRRRRRHRPRRARTWAPASAALHAERPFDAVLDYLWGRPAETVLDGAGGQPPRRALPRHPVRPDRLDGRADDEPARGHPARHRHHAVRRRHRQRATRGAGRAPAPRRCRGCSTWWPTGELHLRTQANGRLGRASGRGVDRRPNRRAPGWC